VVVRRRTRLCRACWHTRHGCRLVQTGHTLAEVAVLRRAGLDWPTIAARWAWRPRAGAHDLESEVFLHWEFAGCPGEPRRPPAALSTDDPRWVRWRTRRDQVRDRWLLAQIGAGAAVVAP
jgi:hypothetical protein